jgi:hypothetical protein
MHYSDMEEDTDSELREEHPPETVSLGEQEAEPTFERLSAVRAALDDMAQRVNHAAGVAVECATFPLRGEQEEGVAPRQKLTTVDEFRRAVFERDEALFQFRAFHAAAQEQQGAIESMLIEAPIDFQKLESALHAFRELLTKAQHFLDRARERSETISDQYWTLRQEPKFSKLNLDLVRKPDALIAELTAKRDALGQRRIGPFRLPGFLQHSNEVSVLTDQLNCARTFGTITEFIANTPDMPARDILDTVRLEVADAALEKVEDYKRRTVAHYTQRADMLREEGLFSEQPFYSLGYVYSELVRHGITESTERNLDEFHATVRPLLATHHRFGRFRHAGWALGQILKSLGSGKEFRERRLFEDGADSLLASARDEQVRATLGQDAVDEIVEHYKTLVVEHFHKNGHSWLDTEGLLKVFGVFPEVEKSGAGTFDRRGANILLHTLLQTDDVLREVDITALVTDEYRERFTEALRRYSEALGDPTGSVRGYERYLRSPHVLHFIARQPHKIEEVLQWPALTPKLFEHFQPGGLLANNVDQVIRDIFSNGDFLRRARETEQFLTQYVPYWKFLFFYTDRRIGELLAGAESSYPISHLGGKPLRRIGIRRLTSMLQGNESFARSVHDGTLDAVPFHLFGGMYKRLIFRDYLQRVVETSRSPDAKEHADRRNRAGARQPLVFQEGAYVHASAVDHIGSVLLNGNLPQEALGESAGIDSYPFHVDFSHLDGEYLQAHGAVRDQLTSSPSSSFGFKGTLGAEGQIYYCYSRSDARGWELGKQYHAGEERGGIPSRTHALILGGIPATEITSIVLAVPEKTLEKTRDAIVENGFYIPVYDLDGILLFTAQEHDAIRQEKNLAVPIETWDYSQKIGEQQGGNPGGTFAVQTPDGLRQYYVKTASVEASDHIWNEQLTDTIYRELGIPTPDTRVVRVEGSIGHASSLLDADGEQSRDQLKNGFLVDALLANWDVVANAGNVLVSGGTLYRTDNGGALLFRARGVRKTAAEFSGVVGELETMRYGYPNVTREDINKQLKLLREQCTDEAIDRCVDSARLARSDREFLKRILRERRDYIMRYFEERREGSSERRDNTLETLLRDETFNDVELVRVVPEWRRAIGEEGYQHNGVLLGEHIKEAVATVRSSEEFRRLSPDEQRLTLVATFFHDFGKPTGRATEAVGRDFDHELPGAQIAATLMKKWGYADDDVRCVVQTIMYDGVVSDIARGKVRDPKKKMTPEQLASALDHNTSTVRILRAVNRADVIATVGASGYHAIEGPFNAFFDELERIASTR